MGKPTNTVFANDFTIVLENLERIQNKAAPDKKKEHLIVSERGVDVICFTRPVFELQRPSVPGMLHVDLMSSVSLIIIPRCS